MISLCISTNKNNKSGIYNTKFTAYYCCKGALSTLLIIKLIHAEDARKKPLTAKVVNQIGL